jgi:cellobiose phosphorylase
MRIISISFFALMLTQTVLAQSAKLGIWQQDQKGLPCFNYTAKIPYLAHLSNGKKVKLPDDPWFLLGNYQFKLFTHISGQYEMITGQRAWGRMNQGPKPNSGENSSAIEILDKKGQVEKSISLTGMNSLAADPAVCKRVFGCGFADYNYKIGEISVDRLLSVKPSTTPYNGTSAFLLTVKIKNNSGKKLEIAYKESVLANYVTIQTQRQALKYRKVKYINTVFRDTDKQLIGMQIKGVAQDPLLLPAKEVMSEWEGYPPSLFMKAISPNAKLTEKDNEINGRYRFTLAKGEEKEIRLIIGYTFENEVSSVDQISKELTPTSDRATGSVFSPDWLKVLPKFDRDTDKILKQELTWHAYVLEAMATYSEYYKETKIPQGTVYDFDWGIHASARDNFQHALPLIYYNPQLAKSVLRYMLKRTTPLGDIRLIEKGNGYADATYYFTSDQQLYFFLLLSEYLRVTKDYDFLKEKVECFPAVNQPGITVLDFVQNCFTFLRDQIGTGNHGLVRLMNSDWNDAIYYIVKAPYNRVLYTGESQMNSAMVISIFQTLIPDLDSAQNTPGMASYKADINRTKESMELYRKSILDAFMKDLGDRKFPRRMYFNGKAYGEDNMFLEPQGFTLQINELPIERKKALYNEMKKRVYPGEVLGAREQQTPEFEDTEFDKGSRENGGFWWALNGPVILGVAQFDKPEAWRLLKNMSFSHFEEAFPQYWSSYWSAADNVESSLIPEKGLPDQTDSYADQPVFCAHPHAWILYCYYKLREMDKKLAN